MSQVDMKLVELIKASRKSDRAYAATLDCMGKCVDSGSAHEFDEPVKLAILTSALMAVETDNPRAIEMVLGKEHVPVAMAISDGLKFDKAMFMHALDLMATDFGCADFIQFQAKSRKIGHSQLIWHRIRAYAAIVIIGAAIMVLLWATSFLF